MGGEVVPRRRATPLHVSAGTTRFALVESKPVDSLVKTKPNGLIVLAPQGLFIWWHCVQGREIFCSRRRRTSKRIPTSFIRSVYAVEELDSG